MSQTKTVLMILAIINMLSLGFFLLSAKRKTELTGTDFLANYEKENEEEPETKIKIQNLTDPLVRLGAYPGYKYNDYAMIKGPKYNQIVWGLYHNNKYCQKVDAYNLENPDNMFKKKNFFTDFPKGTLPLVAAMQKVGKVIDKFDRKKKDGQGKFELGHEITNFYTEISIHIYQQIGKHFLCATQMYNHVPGNGHLVRKTEVIQETKLYAEKYKDKPQCFNKSEFFMPAYRLYIKKECNEFFNLINSQAYNASLEKEPIQYLIKVGIGAHQSQGVFLLDKEKALSLNKEYNFGSNCGHVKGSSLIAQKYITNPLLLDMQNKFDFRIYMLIASTNPLVVYYHDGYLRVAVNSFDKNSTDRATHITNTAVAKKIFAKVQGTNNTYNGMNAKQLKDYHLWYLKDLQNYLLQTGKITDTKWLDNYLRPAFQKVMVHLIRMTGRYLYKGSNVYELHGMDFMLDDNLNLWFIESNPSPLLHGVKPDLIARMLRDTYEIEYAFYRGRMKRVLEVVKKLQDKHLNNEEIDYDELKAEYQQALVNRLEPEYKIGKQNTFVKILDETLPGGKSLLGYLPEECF